MRTSIKISYKDMVRQEQIQWAQPTPAAFGASAYGFVHTAHGPGKANC